LPGAETIDSIDWCDVPHFGRSDCKSLPHAGTSWTPLEPLHDFNEMLVIALYCVLSGGQGAVDMGPYARAKEPFLRNFLKLSNGLPSHDTFSRLFPPA
jgi:DDE_Tnp_1-associated